MKNSILILSIVLFSSHAFSQERTIDWQDFTNINLNKTLLKPVKNRNFAGFKIININKFLFKVEITGKGFNLETPIPTELQTLFRLTPDEKSAITDNKKSTKAAEDIKKENEVMADIKKGIEAKPQIGENAASVNEISLVSIISELNIKCEEYYQKAAELSGKLLDLKILKVELIDIAQMDAKSDVIKKKIQVSNPIPSPVSTYKDFLVLYANVESLYDDAKDTATNESDRKRIEDASKKIEKSFETFKEENIIVLFDQLTFLHNELNNENNYIAQAPPIQMTGDFVEYKCKITPTKTNIYGAYKSPQEISFIIPNNSGAKVDFSVGPTLSLGNNAKNELYFLEESTTTGKSYLRQRDNNNAGLPGVAAMMHVYDRSATETALGLLFGVGAGFKSIDNVDLSFYLGGSLILGRNQKVMLNSGVSLQRVDRLKEKQYAVGKEYTTQDFKLDDVVEKVFKPSLFISLSYSLAKRVDN